jgi:hypothetical protein
VAISIVVAGVVLSFLVYDRVLRVNFFVGTLRFSHWLSIIGTIGIAVATPLFTLLKNSSYSTYLRMLRIHIFGNLVFFTFILFHFATQIARPATNFPELGSGLALLIAMSIQVASGFTQRFRSSRPLYKRMFNPKTNKFVHASLVMVFYFAIIFHVLHGFGLT